MEVLDCGIPVLRHGCDRELQVIDPEKPNIATDHSPASLPSEIRAPANPAWSVGKLIEFD
jgi:hypothetical protein